MYQYQHLDSSDLRSIANAQRLIAKGTATRVDLGHGMTMYKVPSNNPKKYTIRLDIKMEVHPDDDRT